MAVQDDMISQGLVRKRNIWALAFLGTLGILGTMMTYMVLVMGVA